MATQYRCKNLLRLKEVTTKTSLQGIDYLEVGPDQKTLKVYLIRDKYKENGEEKDRLVPDLKKDNIAILGGVRVRGGTILPGSDGELVVMPGKLQVESVSVMDYVLTVVVNQPGDFSTYTLRLVQSSTNLQPPDKFDVQLCEVDFCFKIDCPSNFDCAPDQECPPETPKEPEINYLAKDYVSFRRLMLDRLSVIMPDWKERNPADVGMMLVELLAYAGDQLSYYQDAVATEAYLGTAHLRTSLRRHARLLDYLMHDGCNARAWIYFKLKDGRSITVTKDDLLLTGSTLGPPTVSLDDLKSILSEENPEVFMPLHDQELHATRNQIHFYTWSDEQCCLPRGSTRATLVRTPDLVLKEDDLLLFEEIISPTTGRPEDLDCSHRHVVRLTSAKEAVDPVSDPATMLYEVAWHDEDALPFPLCLSAIPKDKKEPVEVSVACGNLLLADHGLPVMGEEDTKLDPVTGKERHYRPHLKRGPLTWQGRVYDIKHKTPLLFVEKASARSAVHCELREARPSISVLLNGREWEPVLDLLNSDRFTREFVVESEDDGTAYLRFGDDSLGLKPSPDAGPTASYRIGNGIAGNVGAGAIARVVLRSNPSKADAIDKVWNPLPGAGGTEPESLEQIRQFAPQAFRTLERAVTAADWAEIAMRDSEIQKAAASLRWTGSWYTAFVTVDRKGGLPVDETFKTVRQKALEQYRLAGYDLEFNGPVYVPLEIALMVCVKRGYFRSNVEESLLKVFSSFDLPNGQRGFFHPDNFTFGQPLYLAQIYRAAMAIDGVASVKVLIFKRWGKADAGEKSAGEMKPGPFEVLRLDNDPNFPENGKIEFNMQAGL
jgi:hypothetical protein